MVRQEMEVEMETRYRKNDDDLPFCDEDSTLDSLGDLESATMEVSREAAILENRNSIEGEEGEQRRERGGEGGTKKEGQRAMTLRSKEDKAKTR